MKQLVTIPFIALTLFQAGCKDLLFEDPQSFLTTETFYSTSADLETATLAIYHALRNPFAGGGLGVITEAQADDIGRHDLGETAAGSILPDFVIWDASTPNGSTATWSPMYQVIFRSNLVISRAPGIAMTEEHRAGLIAEAKFLRALAYFELIKRFSAGNGATHLGVPIILTEAQHAATDVTRASQEAVFDQIIKDASEAEVVLPGNRTGTALGRATSGAARMLLADVYLWRSSFMITDEWQQASAWAKKVIDSNEYALNNSFFATFAPSNKSNNPEMIFRIIAAGDRANSSVVSTFYPRQLGFAGSPGGGFGTLKPTVWYLGSFSPGDIRGNTGPQSDSVAYRTTACYTDLSRGCPVLREGSTIVPHVWKFRPSSTSNGLGDVDVPIYRYAETLLIFAEAENELGNTGTAIQFVNQVRARARRGSTGGEERASPADLPPTLTQAQARDAIYMERAWELAFEHGHRWFDLVRRDSREPGYWAGQLLAHNPETAGAREPLREYRKRFPIPASEIVLRPSIEQNPGY